MTGSFVASVAWLAFIWLIWFEHRAEVRGDPVPPEPPPSLRMWRVVPPPPYDWQADERRGLSHPTR